MGTQPTSGHPQKQRTHTCPSQGHQIPSLPWWDAHARRSGRLSCEIWPGAEGPRALGKTQPGSGTSGAPLLVAFVAADTQEVERTGQSRSQPVLSEAAPSPMWALSSCTVARPRGAPVPGEIHADFEDLLPQRTQNSSLFLLSTCSQGNVLNILSQVNQTPKINCLRFYSPLTWLPENS